MINKEEHWPYIRWNDGGDGILLVEPGGLIETVLPKYFKGTRVCSYIRQLSAYGFVKSREMLEFKHREGLFSRDAPEKLPLISRRPDKRRKSARGNSSASGDHAHDHTHASEEPTDEDVRMSEREESLSASVEKLPQTSSNTSGVALVGAVAQLTENNATTESLLEYLLRTVNAQRSQMTEMSQQLNALAQIVLHDHAVANVSNSGTAPSNNVVHHQQVQQQQQRVQRPESQLRQAQAIAHTPQTIPTTSSIAKVAATSSDQSLMSPSFPASTPLLQSVDELKFDEMPLDMDDGVLLFDNFDTSPDDVNERWV